MKAGVGGKHTPGGGSRGGGDRGACVWPRASAQQSRSRLEARTRQGACENPPPLKDQKRASIWQHLESALARFERASSGTEARDESLSFAQFPAGAPAATSTHIPHHRHATDVRRAAQLVAKHRRNRSPTFSASGQLCRAPAVSQETRRVPSPSPCPWAGIPAQIRSSTCSTTPTTPSRRRDQRHRGGRGRASRRCRAATACGAFAWKPPARRRTKGRCIAAPAGAAAGSAGPSRRAAASARPRRRMAGSGIRPASSAAARSAMAPPSPTLAWP